MSAAPVIQKVPVSEEEEAGTDAGEDEPLLGDGGPALPNEPRKGQLASRMAGLVGMGSGVGALLAGECHENRSYSSAKRNS